jgi:glycosyltransferase involved in cell wall biosynthesis
MSSRIRVLLLTDEMEVGGTQRQIVHIAGGLNTRRFEPAVAFFRNRSPLVDELIASGVPVTEVSKRSGVDVGFVVRLVRLLRDGQFDVMHCFAFSGELWGSIGRICLPERLRPALITSVRGVYDWYSPSQWRVKRWVSHQSHRVIANSKAGADYAAARVSVPRSRIVVVHNGVQVVQGQPGSMAGSRVVARREETGVLALFVGRLVEGKNIPVLLRAMKRLLDSKVAIRLQIAGDGPLRGECERLVAALHLQDCVELLGERSDVSALLEAADFVVQPSLREGLSNTILEAMAAGRAVIASSVGGNVELVRPMETGLLFPSDDDDALSQAMRTLAADPELRDQFGVKGKAAATTSFSVEAMVQAMEGYYEDGARGRRGCGGQPAA